MRQPLLIIAVQSLALLPVVDCLNVFVFGLDVLLVGRIANADLFTLVDEECAGKRRLHQR